VRIGHVADPLGLVVMDQYTRRIIGFASMRHCQWCRTLQDVQPRHSRATLDAEVPQFRQRSTLQVPTVASQSTDTGGDRNQVHPYVPCPIHSWKGSSAPFDASIWITRCSGQRQISKTSCSISGPTSTTIARITHWKGNAGNARVTTVATLRSFRWQPHCRSLYQTPVAA